jgi:uncharacterized membrane protein
MVSLWWVAAAFFVGGCAGVVLVAVMSMAARQTGDACQPHEPVDATPQTGGRGVLAPIDMSRTSERGRRVSWS